MDARKPDKMRRFVLEHNIKNLTRFLESGKSIDNADYFRGLIRNDRQELAKLNAHEYGAFKASEYQLEAHTRDFDQKLWESSLDDVAADLPCMIFDPRPDMKILDINKAYEAVLGLARNEMIGRPVYEIFPQNPDAPESESIAATLASVSKVVETRQTDIIPVQRYDIQDDDGSFTEQYWRIENVPLLDSDGEVILIRNSAVNITDTMLGSVSPSRIPIPKLVN